MGEDENSPHFGIIIIRVRARPLAPFVPTPAEKKQIELAIQACQQAAANGKCKGLCKECAVLLQLLQKLQVKTQ